jgi:hypothetical protein
MSKAKISNHQARDYVQRCIEFKANNLWSEWIDDGNPEDEPEPARYVVYSYDRHWPLFVYETRTNMWFENASKYGVTTSKHKTQSHPHIGPDKITYLHVDDMIKVANNGVVGIITGMGETA